MICCLTGSQASCNCCLAAELHNADMEADYGHPKDAMGRVLSNDYDTQRMGRMVSHPRGPMQLGYSLWTAAAGVMASKRILVTHNRAESIYVQKW